MLRNWTQMLLILRRNPSILKEFHKSSPIELLPYFPHSSEWNLKQQIDKVDLSTIKSYTIPRLFITNCWASEERQKKAGAPSPLIATLLHSLFCVKIYCPFLLLNLLILMLLPFRPFSRHLRTPLLVFTINYMANKSNSI